MSSGHCPSQVTETVPDVNASTLKQVEPQPQQAPEEAEVEGCEEGADDDDEARSEATFRFRVEGFSTIKDSTLSESCVIRWVTFPSCIFLSKTSSLLGIFHGRS